MLTVSGPDHAEQARGERAPLGDRLGQAPLARRRQRVVFATALLARGAPLAAQQALALQLVQRGVERALFAIEVALAAALDLARQLIAVQRAVAQHREDDGGHRATLEVCSRRHLRSFA